METNDSDDRIEAIVSEESDELEVNSGTTEETNVLELLTIISGLVVTLVLVVLVVLVVVGVVVLVVLLCDVVVAVVDFERDEPILIRRYPFLWIPFL
ncbi:CGH_1_HP_G0001020.mRNA.1.CDS.1 [Saccharomyces cerevisiae]|nr:CGH_1_HP_G0001020.mRNA.1.CDS.1 [Saccharomyces cerevisiae]CAI6604907.1 CGH_1_HP_G0001020.mRNA.1.CDS.1 [Saccharomyces cerevisiae]